MFKCIWICVCTHIYIIPRERLNLFIYIYILESLSIYEQFEAMYNSQEAQNETQLQNISVIIVYSQRTSCAYFWILDRVYKISFIFVFIMVISDIYVYIYIPKYLELPLWIKENSCELYQVFRSIWHLSVKHIDAVKIILNYINLIYICNIYITLYLYIVL